MFPLVLTMKGLRRMHSHILSYYLNKAKDRVQNKYSNLEPKKNFETQRIDTQVLKARKINKSCLINFRLKCLDLENSKSS